MGPIGMLIQEFADNNAHIDTDLEIKQSNEENTSLINTPWGVLQDIIESLTKRARIARASANRDFL